MSYMALQKRLMYSPIPIPQTLSLLFLYIFLEKNSHMKVIQNHNKENKNYGQINKPAS